jgi:hypothetical protein
VTNRNHSCLRINLTGRRRRRRKRRRRRRRRRRRKTMCK